MAYTESDATYCSEVEKDNLSQRRRSKRLSQKLSAKFRSPGHPASQRLEEIHQLLMKNDTLLRGWSKHDWLALHVEVNLLKKSLPGTVKSKIDFIEKKINKYLRSSNSTSNSNISSKVVVDCGKDQSDQGPCQPVTSPNVLAGMMTEVLTELPLYQPHESSTTMNGVHPPNVLLTQVNPLDLTKRGLQGSNEIVIADESVPKESATECTKHAMTNISKDSMLDLTDDIIVGDNQGMVVPVVKVNPDSSKNVNRPSKWLKYLPSEPNLKQSTEQPRQLNNKPTTSSINKPKTFKQSLIELYKENTKLPAKTRRPTTSRSPVKSKVSRKSKAVSSKPRSNEKSIQKQFRNTESIFAHDFVLADISPRHVQSDRISSVSPDFFSDNLISLDLPVSSGDSISSLPFSLKESLKKTFGTDSLDEVLGCEKIIYSLTESHVRRLAGALKVKHDALKRTIQQIVADDNVVLLDDEVQSGSSVVECSQSPPQRRFPSQRSQTSNSPSVGVKVLVPR